MTRKVSNQDCMAVPKKISALIKVCRPNQWTKNLIVFAPILFAGQITDKASLLKVTVCGGAMCLMSSAIYVLNDLVDREADKIHPQKQNRPIASGLIGTKLALALFIILVLAALTIAFLVRASLILVILSYLAIMISYSLWLKHLVLVDVFCIAAGFVLRAVGGASAAHVAVSPWFLLCTSLGSLFLALDKRRQELVIMSEQAGKHRKALSLYSVEALLRMEGLILPSLLTCYAFYSFQSWHGAQMLLTVPLVVFGLMRYQTLSATTTSTATPEQVLLKDRPLQIAIVLWLLIAAAVVYNLIQPVYRSTIDTFDSLTIFK